MPAKVHTEVMSDNGPELSNIRCFPTLRAYSSNTTPSAKMSASRRHVVVPGSAVASVKPPNPIAANSTIDRAAIKRAGAPRNLVPCHDRGSGVLLVTR